MTLAKIVISGYYGFANIGDEAILATLVQELGAGHRLVVLSADPTTTWTEYPSHDVQAIPRMDPGAIWKALEGADLLVSGGGGLMQDVTGWKSIPYYGLIMLLARLRRVPVMVFAQGVGPLNRRWSRWLVRFFFGLAARITVRDRDSVALLEKLGLRSDRVQLTADPVLCLEPDPRMTRESIMTRVGLDPSKPVVAVALRPWWGFTERTFKCVTSVLAEFAREQGVQVLFLPFHPSHDGRLAQEMSLALGERPADLAVASARWHWPLSPAQMQGLLSNVDMVFGMRLHALIMAVSTGVPAVGVVYDPKVEHLCNQWELPRIDSVEGLQDDHRLLAVLTEAWKDRAARRMRLAELSESWRSRSNENFTHLRSLVPPPILPLLDDDLEMEELLP